MNIKKWPKIRLKIGSKYFLYRKKGPCWAPVPDYYIGGDLVFMYLTPF